MRAHLWEADMWGDRVRAQCQECGAIQFYRSWREWMTYRAGLRRRHEEEVRSRAQEGGGIDG